jgi:chemotaxis protein MotA
MNAFEIENLMDHEIETHHHEAEVPAVTIQKVADGLPAFGIAAAVMGVVHTMASVGIPPAELGKASPNTSRRRSRSRLPAARAVATARR